MLPEAEPETISLDEPLREARGRLLSGDTEGSLALVGPLACREPALLPARFFLALVAWKMDRLDWAVALMRDCHERWPMDGSVADALASLYAQAGDLHECLFAGKLALALKANPELAALVPPGFPNFGQAFRRIRDNPKLEEAKDHLAGGRLRVAVEKARQHAALYPRDDQAKTFYAATLLRAGAAGAAVEVMSAAGEKSNLTAEFAVTNARALTAVGEFDAARAWHDRARTAAPEDAVIAAAGIADAPWLERISSQADVAGEAWLRRYCPASPARQWRRPAEKLVIGYHVAALGDPDDAAAIAATARAHDRGRVSVVGYGIGAQSWEENLAFQGAFDAWYDIAALDPATLARYFEREGLHIIVDASGFNAPRGLMALARTATAMRVAWLGNSGNIGAPVYDAQIVAIPAEAPRASSWRVGGGYPILRGGKQMSRSAHVGVQFGSDAAMKQIDGDTVRLWSELLRAQPDAKLLLRGRDMAPGPNIERLVARFGKELAARIDVVEGESMEEFYGAVDVALAPRRGTSPRLAAEALSCGVPVVALDGSGASGCYGAFLRGLGIGSLLVAADQGDYLSIALALAASSDARAQVLVAASTAGENENGAGAFARAIEEHGRRALGAAEVAP